MHVDIATMHTPSDSPDIILISRTCISKIFLCTLFITVSINNKYFLMSIKLEAVQYVVFPSTEKETTEKKRSILEHLGEEFKRFLLCSVDIVFKKTGKSTNFPGKSKVHVHVYM